MHLYPQLIWSWVSNSGIHDTPSPTERFSQLPNTFFYEQLIYEQIVINYAYFKKIPEKGIAGPNKRHS